MNFLKSIPRLTHRLSLDVALAFAFVAGILAFTAHASSDDVDLSPANAFHPIPWSDLATRAGADYKGNGLSVAPADNGARLHCVFQRLDAEGTPEGLWLTSTVSDAMNDRFRVVGSAIGRTADRSATAFQGSTTASKAQTTHCRRVLDHSAPLSSTGTVSVDAKTVRFSRLGLIEEYSVSMDGVRQDFLVLDRPDVRGELRLELQVSGAVVEQTAYGARLVLENSGRKIAYSRLQVRDATDHVLDARIDVSSSNRMAVLVNDAEAVYPVRIDPTFSDENWISMGGIPGANSTVYAAIVDGAGNLFIGGDFTLVGETLADRIARWNGSSWSALGTGMNGRVRTLVLSGGDLYAGGDFTMAGGSAANRVARWNGTNWATLGSGMNNQVHALAVSGSNLYAGGYFTIAGGAAANRIARWSGSNWSGLGSGMDDGVLALAESRGDLYAGGNFTRAGGTVAIFVAKWSGSTWSALGSGVNASVRALAASGTDLYAGGGFSMAGGNAANRIAKWNGSNWSALGSGVNGSMRAITVLGSSVYAGGGFTTAGGNVANGVARWNGSSWSVLGSGMNISVYALAEFGSVLYAGGDFTTAGGTAAMHVAKWDGSSWSALGSGMNGRVLALVLSSNDLYVAGFFTTAGGNEANHVAKWNGNDWSALGSGMNDAVIALAVSGSDLYAGGLFTTAGGTGANRIAKWNGSSWSALGSGMNWDVLALMVSGTDLYAGGGFTMAGSNAANRIAKWDGSSWSALDSGLSGGFDAARVDALAVLGDDLYVGGNFWTAGSQPATNVAKWNGSSWSALGLGVDGGVYALTVLGSDIYAGGGFTTAGGIVANYIARWNGTSWSALTSGMGGEYPHVLALAVSDTDLYAGGGFSMAGGNAANQIAKWDGSSWSALGSGLSGGSAVPTTVSALAVCGSNLYAGGEFTTAGSKVSAYLAKAIIAETTNCSFAISPTNTFFSAAGGSTDVTVTAGSGCSWTAISPCLFVTFTPTSGTGSGVVTVTVDANPLLRARSCTNLIAGREFVVRQVEGSGCIYSIFPTSASFPPAGGSTNVEVGVNNGCSWSASSPCPFVTVTPASGIGPGVVTVTVTTNSGSLSRECQLTIARQSFTVTQAGALEVIIATNHFTTGPNQFRLVAPTNTINLQAIVPNASAPIFQWCRESTAEDGKVIYDDVVFTSPNSGNTTVIFEYAGTYNLSVTAIDGMRSGSLTVTVIVELNTNAVFQNIQDFLNASKPDGIVNTNKFLTRFPSKHADATNYYAAIDPQSTKTNFASWKMANGFPPGPIPPVTDGEIVSATYFNALDLGFGRRMIMRSNSSEWAFAVSNFTNVNDAATGAGLIATVAMDYSPVTNGGPDYFTKFYVFSNDTNETRVESADLDFGGQKFLPGLCVVCHGGTTGKVNPGDSGNVHAHFLPFDLRAFDYSCSNGLTRASQEGVFKALNRGVLDIEQRIPTEDASTNGRPAITNLIHGWYGSGLTNATQNDYFVPAGWLDASMSGVLSTGAQSYLYLNVVAPSCRSCHVTRGGSTTFSTSFPGTLVDFGSFSNFNFWGASGIANSDVFGTNDINQSVVLMSTNVSTQAYPLGFMPHARRTFERFWNSISPRPQAEILRNYLLGSLNNYLTPTSSITAIERIGNDVRISFTTSNGGSYRLEQTDDLMPPISSTPVNGTISGTGGTNRIILPIEANSSNRFFRVRSLP